MQIIKILYTVVIIVSFPVILFTLRSSICAWINVDRTRDKKNAAYFYLIGVGLCGLITVLALAIPSISVIMDLFSSIFGCVIF